MCLKASNIADFTFNDKHDQLDKTSTFKFTYTQMSTDKLKDRNDKIYI